LAIIHPLVSLCPDETANQQKQPIWLCIRVPEEIKEQKLLPTNDQLSTLIERLKEPVSTAVWLVPTE
jgi:hypothetical protein